MTPTPVYLLKKPTSFNEALTFCVDAAGGAKVVGLKLWPQKTQKAAQRHLVACLDVRKREGLSPSEVLAVLRLARDAGYHGGMAFIAEALGMPAPVLLDARRELLGLLRAHGQVVAHVAELVDRIEIAVERTMPKAGA